MCRWMTMAVLLMMLVIKAAIPTIEYILGQGASLVLMSHLGRPKAKPDPKYSLKGVALHLGSLLHQEVIMADDCVGPAVQEMVGKLSPGQILMLENVRFHPGEEKNDPEFSDQLAQLGDIYVNDAFGTAHRAHSSTARDSCLFTRLCRVSAGK